MVLQTSQRRPTRGARARAIAAMVVFALGTATLSTVGVASPAAAAEADTLHSLVNQARAANGLGALSRNTAMDAVALSWANQLAANGALSHNPNYSTQVPDGWGAAAENVAQGHRSASAMHDGWMSSDGHRANILGDFTAVGVAFVAAGGTTWGVQVFARYGASVPPPAPAPAPAPPPAEPAAAPVAPPAPDRTGEAAAGASGRAGPVDDATSDPVATLVTTLAVIALLIATALAVVVLRARRARGLRFGFGRRRSTH